MDGQFNRETDRSHIRPPSESAINIPSGIPVIRNPNQNNVIVFDKQGMPC